jgi:hypothetical protein
MGRVALYNLLAECEGSMRAGLAVGVIGALAFRLMMLGLAPARLKLEVAPRLCASPCDVRVLVKVVPEEDNRGFIVTVNGDNYESSSSQQLDGIAAPYTQAYLWFKELPAGQYDVECSLQTWRGTIAVERTTVEVR